MKLGGVEIRLIKGHGSMVSLEDYEAVESALREANGEGIYKVNISRSEYDKLLSEAELALRKAEARVGLLQTSHGEWQQECAELESALHLERGRAEALAGEARKARSTSGLTPCSHCDWVKGVLNAALKAYDAGEPRHEHSSGCINTYPDCEYPGPAPTTEELVAEPEREGAERLEAEISLLKRERDACCEQAAYLNERLLEQAAITADMAEREYNESSNK